MGADLGALTSNLTLSLKAFLPELAIAAGIVLLLLVRLVGTRAGGAPLALLAGLGATLLVLWQLGGMGGSEESLKREIFSGLLVYDDFALYFRLFLAGFATLVVWLTVISGIPDRMDAPDFYAMLLGATLGMMLMCSANHLLMVFVGVEMASVPSYAMAGFLKGRRNASEAALKYVVYGGGAAGVMLYGISLLTGLFGTAHLPTLAQRVTEAAAQHPTFDGHMAVLALAALMVLAGVCFKLAAVPFHFWCPDVFEGASTEVAAFLSVASKAAALALLARLALSLADPALAAAAPVRTFLASVIAVLAAVTATYGNLAAYAQTNMKRLLAYSTIAHAGYMMMPIAAALVLSNETDQQANRAVQSLLYYAAIYLFMNLGAFAVVAFLRNELRSEDLGDYQGIGHQCPGVAVCMALFLLSLIGLPPLAGFWAKAYIFLSLFEAGQYLPGMYWVLVIAAVNTAISAFYYVKVLRVMLLQLPPAERRPIRLPLLDSPAGIYSLLLSVPVLILGAWPIVYRLTEKAAALVAR